MVDDEPFNLIALHIILRQALRKLGYNPDLLDRILDTANDGQEAVRKVKQMYIH